MFHLNSYSFHPFGLERPVVSLSFDLTRPQCLTSPFETRRFANSPNPVLLRATSALDTTPQTLARSWNVCCVAVSRCLSQPESPCDCLSGFFEIQTQFYIAKTRSH
jgi:hypothetical protein